MKCYVVLLNFNLLQKTSIPTKVMGEFILVEAMALVR